MSALSSRLLHVIGRLGFWLSGVLGGASAAFGMVGYALPSGLCGLFGVVVGMIGAAASNERARRHAAAKHNEAIALAIAL